MDVIKKYIIVPLLLLGFSAHSDPAAFKDECEVTPNVWQLKAWPKAGKSNNLRRPTGGSELAKGDKVIITGTITDENCAPVMGAIVRIWQADSKGLMKGFASDSRKPDPNFLYSGTAITDNFGRYSFITIMPGALPHKPAFINFRVSHNDFLNAETVMFFENQPVSIMDKMLKENISRQSYHLLVAKSEKTAKNIDEESIKYQFDISLEGKNKYLKY